MVTKPILFLFGADRDMTLSFTEKVQGLGVGVSSGIPLKSTIVEVMERTWSAAISRCCWRQGEVDDEASMLLMMEVIS